MSRADLIERLRAEMKNESAHYSMGRFLDPAANLSGEECVVLIRHFMVLAAFDALTTGAGGAIENFLLLFREVAERSTGGLEGNPPLLQEVAAELALHGEWKRSKEWDYHHALWSILSLRAEGLSFNQAADKVLERYPDLDEARDPRTLRRWYGRFLERWKMIDPGV